jgi:general secretion pathway protein H
MQRAKPSFAAFNDKILREVKLARGVMIDGVSTERIEGRVTAGKAYVYFFPTGQVDHAVIHLADENESVLTIETVPLTGRSVIHGGYVAHEELFRDR